MAAPKLIFAGANKLPDKKFLETFPLYKPFAYNVPAQIETSVSPAVNFHCGTCMGDQTFQHSHGMNSVRFALTAQSSGRDPAGHSLLLGYKCASCGGEEILFLVKIADDKKSVMKTGQYPAWDISGDKNLEKLLGPHKKYLKQGLICESQGYGIGAFAYYRRIAEEVIDTLLNDLGEILPEPDKEKYVAALDLVKESHQASDKINLVRDLLPTTLIVDGMNPLGILYKALSEGLHSETDKDCLDYAGMIREVLVDLLEQISYTKHRRKKMTENTRKILEKKAKP